MTPLTSPVINADERTTLVTFLQSQRAEIIAKCEGLDEGLAHRVVLEATSPLMTVAGLISHLRWVEHAWFETVLLGEPDRGPWTDEDPDAEFRMDGVPLGRLIAEYAQQAARSDEIVASLELDATSANVKRNGHPSVRWIVFHMIEETARHAGHLDILREMLDGTVGD